MPHDLAVLPAGADLALLDDDLDFARELVREELAASTRSGYLRDCRLFARWCDARGVSPMPAAPATVAAYIASLVKEGRIRGSTLSRRIAAMGWAHKIAGERDPTRTPIQPRGAPCGRCCAPLVAAWAPRRLPQGGNHARHAGRRCWISAPTRSPVSGTAPCSRSAGPWRCGAASWSRWMWRISKPWPVACMCGSGEARPIRKRLASPSRFRTTPRDRIRPARDLRVWLKAANWRADRFSSE